MRYLIAVILPPLAVFLCGKIGQAILNCILTLFFFVPGVVHALMVVHSHEADKRNKALIRAIQEGQKEPR